MTRRIVATLVVVLALSWSISVVASNGRKGQDTELGTVYFGPGDITEQEALVGLDTITTQSPLLDLYYDLDVPMIAQNDSEWAETEMNGTCTPPSPIGTEGCTLTSACMVFSWYGNSKTPPEMNTCQDVYACPFGFDTAAMSQYCDPDSLIKWIGSTSFSYSTMASYLQNYYPPILRYIKSGSPDHFVVVRSVWGNYQVATSYWINDPMDGMFRNLTYYTDRGYTAYKLCLYQPE